MNSGSILTRAENSSRDAEMVVVWDRVIRFLARQRYGVISTVDPARGPESALVGVAWWQPLSGAAQLIFDTTSVTRKVKNIANDPRCSFVIGWEDETTVQLEGRARWLEGSELERAKRDYFRIWPECRAHERWPDVAYFSVRPTWLRYPCYLESPTIMEFDEQQLATAFQRRAAALFAAVDPSTE